ncbi:MAG: ABC transporter permease [Sphaerochaetaceae bacterium]|nr:ABC transporter permease [Sphaerochaetaceae bacterium]
MDTVSSLIFSAVTIMTPLLLAATGGLYTELTGMLNIGIEGLMLLGAFSSVVSLHFTHNIVLAILIGTGSSMLLAAVIASITLYLKANVFITGLAANLFASGITTVLSFHIFANKGVVTFPELPQMPVLFERGTEAVPVLGPLLFGHTFFTYLSFILLFLSYVVLYRTPFGFRLRATGLYPKSLISVGLSPKRYQFIAFLISGFFSAVAGAMLSVNLGAFVPNITAGKGWVALVVIFLGQKRPVGLLIASFIFGISEAFSNYAQGIWHIPSDFILAIPYIFTLVAIVFYSIYDYNRQKVE